MSEGGFGVESALNLNHIRLWRILAYIKHKHHIVKIWWLINKLCLKGILTSWLVFLDTSRAMRFIHHPTAKNNGRTQIKNDRQACFPLVSWLLCVIRLTFFHIDFLCHIQTGITVNKNSFIMISTRDLTRLRKGGYVLQIVTWTTMSRRVRMLVFHRFSKSESSRWKKLLVKFDSFRYLWLATVLSVRYQSSWESDWGGKYHH